MAKVTRGSIISVAGIVLAGLILLYVVGNKEPAPGETDDSSQDTQVYVRLEADLPPKAKASIDSAISDLGWEIAQPSEDADVDVTYAVGDERTGCESGISLYQVYTLSVPYRDMLDTPENKITRVSEAVDLSDNLSQLDLYTIEVESDKDNLSLQLIQETTFDRYAIPVNEIDPFDKATWNNPVYPLISQICFQSRGNDAQTLFDSVATDEFLENSGYMKDLPRKEDFVTIMKTGTSVTGGPGWFRCERLSGLDYPIQGVAEKLREADISIISNETSFVEGCTQQGGTTSFCGKPSYLQNILDMGIDVVSLTGNHMSDFGRTSFQNMLDTYSDNNIEFFGAGYNEDEAWSPLIYETSAGTIAFIGYNAMGPAGVLATATSVGSAEYDPDLLATAIESSLSQADIVWVDNHLWPEYGTTPDSGQIARAHEAIDLGADIVTGVSSHQIQSMTFYNDGAVFYGLGNFLFDQTLSDDTHLGIAVEAFIYDGSIRRLDVHPTRVYDYCQPRFLTGSEREYMLNYLFSISDL